MLKIWGRDNSINVQQVMWIAGELGLEVERIDVGGAFGGLDTPEYGRLNPNRRIPTLEDGDVVVWESNAIVRYLAARYGGGAWYPEDPAARAHADMWMDWTKTTAMGPMTVLFWGLVRTPQPERDANAIGKAAREACDCYARLDAWLEGRDFVMGDALSMADVPAGALAWRFFELVTDAILPDRPDLPNLAAWYARLGARPAYRRHVMLPLT